MTLHPRQPVRPHAAYTLIELLIVIALLGIASTLLIPHMVGRDSLQVQAAVRHVIGDLSFAQSDALAHQEYRRVHFYDDGRGYCLVRVDQSELGQTFDPNAADYINDPMAKAGELGRYIVDFTNDKRFEGVSISSVDIDNGRRDLHYDPLGGTVMAGNVPGTGGTIVLSAADFDYEITIAPFTGKLTVRQLP